MNLLCATSHENDQLRITTASLYKKQIKDGGFKNKKEKEKEIKNSYVNVQV